MGRLRKMETMRKMAILAAAVVLAVVVVVPTGAASETTIIELETVASGLTAPVGLTHAGDGSGRLFIVEQTGQIRIVEDGTLLTTPFLDISGLLPSLNPFFDERGLLCVA
ncbi:MAG: hypothetical protein IH918_08760, partial [Acidobacteria bacterium]|nr:hypothetical protein [Acidobacteriota bacterium]